MIDFIKQTLTKLRSHKVDNSIYTMRVYRDQGSWVFDNPAVGLYKEPFVAGADEIFDEVCRVRGVLNPEKARVDIIFSDQQFPSWDLMAEHLGPSMGGNDYSIIASEYEMLEDHDFWLCPALLKYYSVPPERIYMRVPKVSCKP